MNGVIKLKREDFRILNGDLVYFDSAATSLRPNVVVDSMVDYYDNYNANAHRGDYDNSLKVDTIYEAVRDKVKCYINADSRNEIVFTNGTTESINMIVFGFMINYLKSGDEVLITKAEHASNVIPWFELEKRIGIKVNYIDLDSNYKVSLDNVKRMVTEKTRVISLAMITNVIGDIRPIEEISKFAHLNNILVVVDGAQAMMHEVVDVKKMEIDFLAFSAHKMLGPTGVGVLYGKHQYLDRLVPLNYGGGMNNSFESNKELQYKNLPLRLEAGTRNIAGVIGFGAAIDYINDIGLDVITSYERDLRSYLIEKLNGIDNIEVYNKNSESGIVIFNIKDIFAEDTSKYLNSYKICIRAGNHCTKMIKDNLGVKNTCRISLAFYNTKEEIDRLIDVLADSKNIFNVII